MPGNPLEPNVMPIEGGLRIRLESEGILPDSRVVVGSVPASNIVATNGALFATAPAQAAGSYDVIVQNGTGQQTVASLGYVEDLLTTVQAAVGSYLVALQELVERLAEGTAAAAVEPTPQEMARADWDIAAANTDIAIYTRASLAGQQIDTAAINAVWNDSAARLDSLQAQLLAGPTS